MRNVVFYLVLVLLVATLALVGGVASAFALVPSSPAAIQADWIAYAEAYANNPNTAKTIGEISARTGATESQVVAMSLRMSSALKNTGVKIPAGSVGSLVAGGVVGTVAGAGLSAAADWLVGTEEWYTSDGTRVNNNWWDITPLLPFGEPIYLHMTDGAITDGSTASAIEWMFSELPEYGVGNGPGPPAGLTAVVYGGGPLAPDAAAAFWYLVDTYTGETVTTISTGVWYLGHHETTPIQWYVLNTAPTIAVAAMSGSYYLEHVALHPGWGDTGSYASQPAQSPGIAAPVGAYPAYHSITAPGGLSSDSTIQELLDVSTVPLVVPETVQHPEPFINPGTGVGTIDGSQNQTGTALPWLSNFFSSAGTFTKALFSVSPDTFADKVVPEIAALRYTASSRWPFAAGTFLAGVVPNASSIGGGDPMEWYVDCSPPILADYLDDTGSVGVWIRPLTWMAPFRPYRWVFVSAIAIGTLLALFMILRPKVHV